MDQSYLLNMLATGLTKMDWVGGSQNTAPDKSGDPMSDFQKMLDEKAQSAKPESKEPPKEEAAPAPKKEEAPVREEDPVETVKRMQVCLVPVSPEELAQYPAEWLPQVQEGEAIVCLGVQTDENGQQMPILMGANEAAKRGWKVATPETMAQQLQDVAEAPQQAPQAPAPVEAKEAPVQEDVPVVEQAEDSGAQPQSQEGEEVQVLDSESAPRPVFEDVEAAPIKVGDTTAPEESGKPQDVGAQLANGIGGALQKGESRVTVSLTPESLGTVRVEITRSQDGMLHVALSADNSQTRSLLEKHAMNLQTLLGSQRQETVQVEVQHQENQQQNNPYDGHNGHNGQPQQEEQQRHHKDQRQDGQDFLHQLRLGLLPVEAEVS